VRFPTGENRHTRQRLREGNKVSDAPGKSGENNLKVLKGICPPVLIKSSDSGNELIKRPNLLPPSLLCENIWDAFEVKGIGHSNV